MGGWSTTCLSHIFSRKVSHYPLYKRLGGPRGRSGVQGDNIHSYLSKFERTHYEAVRVVYVTRLPYAAENVRGYYLGHKRAKSSLSYVLIRRNAVCQIKSDGIMTATLTLWRSLTQYTSTSPDCLWKWYDEIHFQTYAENSGFNVPGLKSQHGDMLSCLRYVILLSCFG